MQCRLAFTALAASFAIGSCQFAFLERRDGAQSSSFSSSSSWSRGEDGEMHKKTKTTSTEFQEDGSQVMKKTVCRDGDCEEVVEVIESDEDESASSHTREGSPVEVIMLEPPSMLPFSGRPCGGGGRMQMMNMGMPKSLSSFVDQFFGQMQPVDDLESHQKQVDIVLDPQKSPIEQLLATIESQHQQQQQQQHPQMEIVIERMDSPMDMLRPLFLSKREQKIPPVQDKKQQQQHPKPPPTVQAVVNASAAQDMTLIQIGVALFALIAAYAVVLSVLKCRRMDQVSARERPLRDLSEPLAPAPVNMALPGTAPSTSSTPAAAPVKTYLLDLYARVEAKNEARAVTQYLARLYKRVLA